MPKTAKSRPKTRSKRKQNDNPPTAGEWRKMKPYGVFKIEDDEGECHEFRQGDDALVLPEGKSPDSAATMADYEFWVARIVEIRSRSNRDVWVRVKWFWSPHDVAKVLPTLRVDPSNREFTILLFLSDSRHCSKYELLASESQDIISALTFSAVKIVEIFDESDTDPSEIGPYTLFARYKFLYTTRTIARFGSVHISLCLCGESYNPDEAVKRPSERTMHFCPHCVQAFHRECLAKHNFSLPPSQDKFPFDPTIHLMPAPPLKELETEDTPETPVPHSSSPIPSDLLLLAQQPLFRPTFYHSNTAKPMVVSNVAGNIAPVIKARKLIQQVVNGTKEVPEDWRSEIGVERPPWTTFVEKNFVCPNCGGPI